MENKKPWYKSRTIRIAIITGIIGIIGAFESQYPELQTVSFMVALKSVIDIFLRIDTTVAIEK